MVEATDQVPPVCRLRIFNTKACQARPVLQVQEESGGICRTQVNGKAESTLALGAETDKLASVVARNRPSFSRRASGAFAMHRCRHGCAPLTKRGNNAFQICGSVCRDR